MFWYVFPKHWLSHVPSLTFFVVNNYQSYNGKWKGDCAHIDLFPTHNYFYKYAFTISKRISFSTSISLDGEDKMTKVKKIAFVWELSFGRRGFFSQTHLMVYFYRLSLHKQASFQKMKSISVKSNPQNKMARAEMVLFMYEIYRVYVTLTSFPIYTFFIHTFSFFY